MISSGLSERMGAMFIEAFNGWGVFGALVATYSRIDNATLQLVLSNATVEGTKTAKVRVYATNYNVLRVMSGMGGLAYSN